jgi:L-ascorbate metabolism protein UlaG (beta-lactamase superfamily)
MGGDGAGAAAAVSLLPAWLRHAVRGLVGPTVPASGSGAAPTAGHGEIVVTYVGHATTLIQLGGVRVLTDPVYAERLVVPKRLVAPGIPIEALPPLDIVLVSHGHYDHLDVPTHHRLPNGTIAVVAENLGDLVAPCGYARVVELPWGRSFEHRGIRITALPVKHWGTRNLLPDSRGYTGFLLESAAGAVFFPGDTAYFPGFRDYGSRFAIDVALLPIGAYSPPSFRNVHMNPEDAFQAFVDLRARWMVPIHWGTFTISLEPVDEPVRWLADIAAGAGVADRVAILRHGESRHFTRATLP